MLRLITPHLQLANVYELSPERLLELGLDGLLLDVDCTLKDHHATVFPAATFAWVKEVSTRGIRLCLMSNGRARRIGGLAETLGVPFVAKAFKPFPFGCHAGVRTLGLPRARIAMVGDQVFADIMAGRLAGLFTILVRPSSPEEPWFTRVKRPPERWFLRWLNGRGQPQAVSNASK